MAEVIHGNQHGNQINVSKDKTQAYGLSGNDTLISNGKNDVLLIGGSGKDRLIMMGGVGTLSGGADKDTFELTYSADNPITAVIEDFEPSKDKISVNFVGKTAPRLSSVKSGDDVVWKDKDGLFNLTLKSVRDNDYFDGKANPKVWDVLKITNDERETKGLSPLTLSEGLMLGASIRAEEITALGESGALPEYKHTRPSGLSYATVFEEIGKSYHNHGENLDAGADSPVDVMQDWMNSPAHRKNILDGKFLKLGVGYDYRAEDPTENQHYWVQLFADSLNNPETVSMADISVAQVNAVSKSVTLTGKTYDNTVYGATIQARDKKDTITNSGLAVSIAGGAGDDLILNSGSFSTICAGAGNDRISLASNSKENLIQYAAGDGFDTISGFHVNDTLSIAGGEYTFAKVGKDVVVTVGADEITLSDAASLKNINFDGTWSKIAILTDNKDAYSNTVSGATIRARAGDDFISNYAASSFIDGEKGNDFIQNSKAANVLISGGFGEDSVVNSGSSVVIIADADNDSIQNSGSYVTIEGGFGNDRIILTAKAKNNVIQYNLGDGNDKIYGFNDDDTLNISDAEYATAKSGKNIVVAVGTDSITLVNAKNLKTLNIEGKQNKQVILTESSDAYNNSVEGATIRARGGNDSIKNSGENVSICAGNGNDQITLTSDAKNNVIQYNLSDGNDTVVGFRADSTLQLGDGSDSYFTFKNGNDIVVRVGKNSITLADAATLPNVHIAGTKSEPADLDKLITLTEDDDNYSNTISGATIEALGGNDKITLASGSQNFIQYTGGFDTISGFDKNDTLQLGDGYDTYSTLAVSNDIVAKVGTSYLWLLNAASLSGINIIGTEQELVDADKITTLTANNDTHNGNESAAMIFALGGDDTISNTGANTTIDAGADNDLIENYGHHALIIGGSGNDTLLNLISKGEDTVDNKLITGTNDADNIENTVEGATIQALGGNDTITNYGASSIINGGNGDDSIFNDASYILYQYSSGDGNDTIYGFNETSTLSIGGGSFSSVTSDEDIIVTVGDDSILLVEAAGLSSINIDGTEDTSSSDSKLITLTEGNDTYDNTVEGATILALAGDDTISNSGASVSIDGGAGNDSINHIAGQYVTINSGAGDDFIDNSGSSQYNDYITINSGTGDDSISNGGHDVTINAGDGNDTVENHRDWVVINGGAGADYITTKTGIMAEGHVTINGGSNNDTIINSNPYSDNSISGGAGSDSIINAGASSTISGGAGNDIISLASSAIENLIEYSSGDGNDTVYGFNETSTLSIGGGSYTSTTSGDDLILTVGDDSILLVDAASLSSINIDGAEDTTPAEDSKLITLTEGNDSYNNTVEGATILALGGNDTITNYGASSIINGGNGDDSIFNDASYILYQYSSGDGNDTVYGFNETSTLSIGGGSYTSMTNGDDLILTVGDDSILLVDAASLSSINIDGVEVTSSKLITLTEDADTCNNSLEGATINALAGDDTITNSGASVSISGGADADEITNNGASSTITGGTGNDYIYNAGADFVSIISDEGSDTIYNNSNSVTIEGGAGADSIRNYYGNSGKNVSISGGADNDTIHLGSYDSYVTVSGGTGDDRISLGSNGSGNVVVYNEGDGNDSVEGFNATSTLQIDGGNGTYSTQISGSNIIVTVGDGSIRLINRASLASSLNIDGVEDTTPAEDSKLITLTEGDDTYDNTLEGATIQALAGNDDITNYGSNVSIVGESGNDSIYNNSDITDVTILAGDDDDYVYNWGNLTTIDGGLGNDSIINNGSDSVTISSGAGADSVLNGSNSYSLTSGNSITLTAGNLVSISTGDDNDYIYNGGSSVTIDGGAGNDSILNSKTGSINAASNVSISGGTGDDQISLNGGENVLINYTVGDGSDIIYGFNETATLSIGSSFSSVTNDNNDLILTVGNDSISLIGAATLSTVNIVSSTSTISFNNVVEPDAVVEDDADKNKIVSYNSEDDNDTLTDDGTNYSSLIGGDGADYIGNQGNHVLIDGGAGDDSIQNESTAAYSTIAGGAGRDSIENYGASSIIEGGKGNDSVTNAAAQVSIDAGAGNDFITNSAAQVSISGGKGSDTISLTSDAALNLIQYTSGDGDDIIYGFNSNTTLQISGKGYSSMTSGKDIVLTVDDGKITLAGAASLSTVNIDLVIPSIPADALHYNGHYYHLFNKGFTWEDAQAYCESRGGYLLTVTDKDEQDAVQSLLDENGSKLAYWLGGYKNADGWQWVTDEEFSYTNWSDDQPDGSGNYLHMYAMKDDGAYKGKWDDTTNDLSNAGYTKTKQGFICEWGDDTESDSKIIRLTENADFYHNLLDDATVLALGDNDTVGNDGDNVSISGGNGNDSIENRGSNVTLDGGKGNDRIRLSRDSENTTIQYRAGDGNDTVWGISANSTLNLLIDKKSNYSSVTSGNDIKINIVGGGSITLKDAKNKSPHIIIGASGSSGGSSGGSGNGGTSGNGGSGGSTGGTSGSGGNSGASGGNSAGGSSGSNSSGSNGSSGNGNRNYSVSRTTSVRQNPVTVPSGNQFISNYQSGQKLYLGSEYTGAFFDNAGDFVAGSATGAICVRNALEKVIDFSDGAGNLIKAYAARNAGIIDGRNIAGREIINGSNGSDTIYAGDGGSQLWGGEGFVQDILVGGGGSDTFLSGKGHGADLIRNASSADVVYLKDASLSDITATSESNGMISVSFNTGNVINVQSTESMSARFTLTDGSAYRYNLTTKAWETLQKAPPTANQSTYTGDNQIVSAGRYGDKIVLDTNFTDMNYDGASNFVVNAPTGALVVRNAVDKIIDLRNVKGTPITKAYAASTPGLIDGRGLAGREIINGSAGADVICAGDGGSQLWGGADNAADVLIGGDGADVFIGGKNQGADLFLNASVEDVVNLNDATISDITAATESGGKISISFNTGNTINVQSSLFLSAKFILADGATYRYSHTTKSWRTD